MICVHCNTPLPDGSKFCTQCGADPSDPGSSPRTQAGATATDLFSRLKEVVGDRYDIEQLLGRGGMGAVFLAQDKTLERPVAIKVLPPELSHDQNFVGRFEREARTAAKLDHPGIIPIYAVEAAADLHYFVMKYVTGRSLDDILRSGPMPIDLVQRILWECAVALGHAHQRGVIHRDVKPANIMIDDAGRAMLTDFGISKAQQAATQFTATGQVIGTPHYMSPEQAKGLPVDGRSDQYALGVVAYRMLTGRLPFAEESVHTVIYKHIFEDPEPVEMLRPEVPPFLATAIKRAMAKDPDDRFATMEDFATAVWPERPVAGGTGVAAPAMTGPSSIDAATQITPTEDEEERKKRGAPVALIAVVVLLLGGGAGGAWWFLSGRQGAEAPGGGAQPAAQVPVAATDTGGAAQAPADTAPEPVEPQPQPVTPTPQPAAAQPARQPVAVTPPARPRMGFLTIAATPFGTVYVDDVEIGDTPIARYELRPGAHVIRVQREGYQTVVDTVQVTAGSTTRRRYTLIPEGP